MCSPCVVERGRAAALSLGTPDRMRLRRRACSPPPATVDAARGSRCAAAAPPARAQCAGCRRIDGAAVRRLRARQQARPATCVSQRRGHARVRRDDQRLSLPALYLRRGRRAAASRRCTAPGAQAPAACTMMVDVPTEVLRLGHSTSGAARATCPSRSVPQTIAMARSSTAGIATVGQVRKGDVDRLDVAPAAATCRWATQRLQARPRRSPASDLLRRR